MARRALSASLVLTPFAVALAMQGCTQDFSTFDPTGSGGGDPTTSTASSPTTTTGTSPTTTTGPGGGDGGGTTVTSGGGGGSPPTDCEVPADCDDDNPCTDDGCNDGVCANTAVADGPLVEDDEDCRTIECAAGVLVDEPNDAEDPADANPPCELTICQDGAPTPEYADDTTSCGPDPQFCDGEGVCVGCDPAPPDQDECGAATACSAPDCVDPGVCDPGFLPAGTAAGDPQDGDCQADECTGSSAAPASVTDNTDVPANLPCGQGACNAGVPGATTVTEGMPCLVGTGICDGAGTGASSCKTCRDTVAAGGQDPGCSAATPICDESAGNGACRTCTDSAAGASQDLGCSAALPVCDTAANGGAGACRACVVDAQCPGDDVCDPASFTCVNCYSNGGDGADPGCQAADGMNPRCVANVCGGCTGPGDCTDNPRGDDCSGNNGNPGQCNCNADDDCAHDEATGPDCNMGTNVCQP